MWPYWLMFLLVAAAALVERPRLVHANGIARPYPWDILASVAVFGIALMLGFRYEVGGDWQAYLLQFDDVQGLELWEVLSHSDPGYALLNWVSAGLGWGIYGVNVVCGGIFATGLLRFCLSLPRRWLALAVAVPYMLVVVGMGYTRQAVALGLSMIALVELKNRSVLSFVIWGLVAAMFHKTAVLLLPIAGLASSRNRWLSLGLAATTTYVGYLVLLQDSFETMYTSYVGGDVQSEGAMVRLLMNAVPSLILLFWRKRFQFSPGERSLWQWFAILSLGLLLGLFVFGSASTAIDRMALYMLPVQLVVFSHLPGILGHRRGISPRMVKACVVAYYAAVLFVWLNFANYAAYWLPYRFYPLVVI